MGRVYYCHKFDPFKCLVWRGLATPPANLWIIIVTDYQTWAGKFYFFDTLTSEFLDSALFIHRITKQSFK